MTDNLERTVERRHIERWHVGKEIPIALVITLFLQSAAGIWWAATTTSELRSLKSQLEAVALAQFTSQEARGLITVNAAVNAEQARRIADVESRLRDIERVARK